MMREMMTGISGGKDRKCAVCGKRFVWFPEWVYKRGYTDHERFFCSYSCMRQWEHDNRKPAERREAIIRAIRDGLSNREIIALLDEEPDKIRYWRRKLEAEEADADD